MEGSKGNRVCAIVMVVLLVAGSAQASCTVKNSSGSDLLILPVVDAKVKVLVKVGAVVEIAPIYLDVVIKNLKTGHKSNPVKLPDGSVVVCVDGIVKATVDIYLGGLLNGVISLLSGAGIIVKGI